MREKTRGRNRRKNSKNINPGFVIGVFAVLFIVFGILLLNLFKQKETIAGEDSYDKTDQVVSEAAIAEEKGDSADKTALKFLSEPTEVTAEEIPEKTPEDVKKETAKEVTDEPPAETTKEMMEETAEGETEQISAGPEPEVVYLKNLDEYRPGDLIPKEKIDPEHLDQYFEVYKISREGNVFSRINGRSYRDNDNIALSDLRYLQMPHYNFDGNVQLGELIVNKAVAEDIVAIFKELYRNKYQIEKMYLIDNYWTGDGEESDTNSIDHNNTSAFCYRTGTGSSSLSRHAYGMAIDINPQQNPYVSYSTGEPKWSHSNANDYIARDTGYAHVITHDDLAYRLFTEHGFTWGGDWTNPKDYQHFEIR